ncbi:MAG TPA: aldo/keto reductase [Pilimelia sp.]|nr:aldo/keto reductase [Pilimelia sp.]
MRSVPLGRSKVAVSRLGLGCASIGNLYKEIEEEAAATAVDAAWDAGIRYFDTAPHYGLGLSERRLGAALRMRPRDEYVLSTKVGRLLEPDPAGEGRQDAQGFAVPATLRRRWDFTAAGVRRSLAESLDRLGLDRVDVVLIHDPEESGDLDVAVHEAYPALHEMRADGTVGAIGVGSKSWEALQRFVVETDIDVIMLAGRYTLLEQPALDTLLPACAERGVSVLNVGVFNSGLLAVDRPHSGLTYEYTAAPPELVAKAQAIADVCARHGVSLPAAALAFAGAHPCVASVVMGAATADHVRRNVVQFTADPPPPALWTDMVEAGLLRPDAPVPGVPA